MNIVSVCSSSAQLFVMPASSGSQWRAALTNINLSSNYKQIANEANRTNGVYNQTVAEIFHLSKCSVVRKQLSQHKWYNPCGGHYNPTQAIQVNKRVTYQRKIMRELQNESRIEYKTIRQTAVRIDIKDIGAWQMHQDFYRFLPKLQIKSNVALQRWHRQMQIYVAAFGYLKCLQAHWDICKLLTIGKTTIELEELQKSARNILCYLEMAINNTNTYRKAYKRSNFQMKRKRIAVHYIKPKMMEKKLNFRTVNRHPKSCLPLSSLNSCCLHEINIIDLKFTKYRYFLYLRRMISILHANYKRTKNPTRQLQQTSRKLRKNV